MGHTGHLGPWENPFAHFHVKEKKTIQKRYPLLTSGVKAEQQDRTGRVTPPTIINEHPSIPWH